MEASQFITGFPGQLVPITFSDVRSDGTRAGATGLAFVPHELPPAVEVVPLVGRLFDVLDRARASLMRLDGVIDNLPGRTVLLRAMRTREAQASSRIENTHASLEEIAIADVEKRRASGEAMEVLRNRAAIEAGLASDLPVSKRLACMMHAELITDRRHRPGQFRDIPVCIGDPTRGFAKSRFVPPPASRVDECMSAWEKFCNPHALGAAARERLPYFVELACAHYQFEAIHPFSDGNGRLGRAMVTLAPVKDGQLQHPVCNLSEWVQTHRQEYYDRLLRVSTHGEWDGWIRYFCTALAEQAEADFLRAKRLGDLYEAYAKKLTTKRASTLGIKLLDHVFDKLVVTVAEVERVLGVSNTSAASYVAKFEELGIVQQVGPDRWNRLFLAHGVRQAIRGDGEDVPSGSQG